MSFVFSAARMIFSGIETLLSLISSSNSSFSQIFFVCILGIFVWNIMLVVHYLYNSLLFVIFVVSKIIGGSLSFVQTMLDITNGQAFKNDLRTAAQKKDATSFIQAFFTGIVNAVYKDEVEVKVKDIVVSMNEALDTNAPGDLLYSDPLNPSTKK